MKQENKSKEDWLAKLSYTFKYPHKVKSWSTFPNLNKNTLLLLNPSSGYESDPAWSFPGRLRSDLLIEEAVLSRFLKADPLTPSISNEGPEYDPFGLNVLEKLCLEVGG